MILSFIQRFIYYLKKRKAIAGIVGSSNFTQGGMSTNIESNILLDDDRDISLVKTHLQNIWDGAGLLSPDDVDEYEKKYDEFNQLSKEFNKEKGKYEHKRVKPRLKRTRIRMVKEARDYFEYC